MKTYSLRNGETLMLKEGRPQDAKEYIQYINQAAGESINLTFGRGQYTVSLDKQAEEIEKLYESDNQLFLLAHIDGEIVGNLTFHCGTRPRTRHTGEFGISILQKYWGQGIGKYLIAYMLEWARETKTIYKINLRVLEENNRAIELYRKMGFIEEGRIKRGFFIGEKFYDAILMGICID
jgi:RimJ/RimL family protein N-acetyltransferase